MDSDRKKALLAFIKFAGLRFKSLELLNLAFVHRSAGNELGTPENNERLEFLGDAVLGLAAVSLLYQTLPGRNEGELAKIKSVVVSEEILSGMALELQLDGLLILGKGEDRSGGRKKKAILADTMEALIGAVYLDGGFKAAWNFVSGRLEREIGRALENRSTVDYKSMLQEYSQKTWKMYPSYVLVKKTGPEHDRLFFITVTVNGETFGPSTGRNKKSAEQEAAKIACEAMSLVL